MNDFVPEAGVVRGCSTSWGLFWEVGWRVGNEVRMASFHKIGESWNFCSEVVVYQIGWSKSSIKLIVNQVKD